MEVDLAVPIDIEVPDGPFAHGVENERLFVPRAPLIGDGCPIQGACDLVGSRLQGVRPQRDGPLGRVAHAFERTPRVIGSVGRLDGFDEKRRDRLGAIDGFLHGPSGRFVRLRVSIVAKDRPLGTSRGLGALRARRRIRLRG